MDPSTQNTTQPNLPANRPPTQAAPPAFPSSPQAESSGVGDFSLPAAPAPAAANVPPAMPPATPYQSAPIPGQLPSNPLGASVPNVTPVSHAPQVSQAPPQAGKVNPNSTQNTLQIAEVRDGIVIMNDGSFRSVVMVKSINFDLMSLQEQEAVESGYQGFLNSLYFPIQIFIRSQKVDLQPYIDKLDKIRTEHDNMLLALLMEDYIQFMANLSTQTNIMDKKFYVIIPYFPVADVQKAITSSKNFFTGLADLFSKKERHVVINEQVLEQAKAELRNRVQAVLAGFAQCGVQGLPLDTQELIELYYDTYNPDTATRQQLKDFNGVNTPVVTKGQGAAPKPNLDRSLL